MKRHDELSEWLAERGFHVRRVTHGRHMKLQVEHKDVEFMVVVSISPGEHEKRWRCRVLSDAKRAYAAKATKK